MSILVRWDDSPKLTKAQKRILAEVRERPGRVYSGRHWLPLIRLRDLGLVTLEFSYYTSTSGDRITVRPT